MFNAKIIYISLTGMTEPLGRSQVLEYLIDLSKTNKIHLISFEREQDLALIDEIQELTYQNNIEWHYLLYTNKYGVFSTLLQILQVAKIGSQLIKKESIDIIHARSMIPATIGMILKKVYRIKLLFDIRGFAIDEKLDSGRLKEGSLLYKTLKSLDNYLYKNSDHIVTLTHKAKAILHETLDISNAKMTVIPTCANTEIFKKLTLSEKDEFKLSLGYKLQDKIIIHTGTVSGWYDFDNEVKLLKELMLQDEDIHFLVLNKHEHTFISKIITSFDLPQDRVKVLSSSFIDMHKYLNIANYSLFFIHPSYSKQASAPTKFAENVACLLPSITNSGVGDMEYYMNNYNVGYLIDKEKIDTDSNELVCELLNKMTYDNLDEEVFSQLFYKYFDKNMAVAKYQKIYDTL